jgi:ribosome recycling factor
MLEDIYSQTKQTMEKSLDALKRDFGTLRTGRVSTKILDNINVNYYGTPTALNAVANISIPDASTIMISPWEKNMVGEIEKSISAANIGVTPNNNGEAVILRFPPMTKDQRLDTAKQAKAMGEKAKVAVRNNRKDGNDKVKKLEKNKEITEDESKSAHDHIQKITDSYIKTIDEVFSAKEEEILKI